MHRQHTFLRQFIEWEFNSTDFPQSKPNKSNLKPVITLEEEMELFGIQNDCVRVKEDFVNGGYVCDDFE